MKKLLIVCTALFVAGSLSEAPAQESSSGSSLSGVSGSSSAFASTGGSASQAEMFVVPASQPSEQYLPKTALKTNLLYLATTTLNIGAEFGLTRKWTLDVTAGLNPWDLNGRKGGIRHWVIQPEARFWFCQRFEKHFVGLHGLYGSYQIMDIDLHPFGNDLTGRRYDGWGAGAGVSYGYHLPMAKRWAWEFTAGVGYIYLKYEKYSCGDCDRLVGTKSKHYFGPTKVGISLIYMIK